MICSFRTQYPVMALFEITIVDGNNLSTISFDYRLWAANGYWFAVNVVILLEVRISNLLIAIVVILTKNYLLMQNLRLIQI